MCALCVWVLLLPVCISECENISNQFNSSGKAFVLESAIDQDYYVYVKPDNRVHISADHRTIFFFKRANSSKKLYEICSLEDASKCLRHQVSITSPVLSPQHTLYSSTSTSWRRRGLERVPRYDLE